VVISHTHSALSHHFTHRSVPLGVPAVVALPGFSLREASPAPSIVIIGIVHGTSVAFLGRTTSETTVGFHHGVAKAWG